MEDPPKFNVTFTPEWTFSNAVAISVNDAVSDVAANTVIEPLNGTTVVVGAAVVGVTVVAEGVVVEAVVVEAFVVVVAFAFVVVAFVVFAFVVFAFVVFESVVVGFVVFGFVFEVVVVASVGDAPNSASNAIMTGTIR